MRSVVAEVVSLVPKGENRLGSDRRAPMRADKLNSGLDARIGLSHEMLSAAEKGDLQSLASLDLERMELLKSFRNGVKLASAADQTLLQQINDVERPCDRTDGASAAQQGPGSRHGGSGSPGGGSLCRQSAAALRLNLKRLGSHA